MTRPDWLPDSSGYLWFDHPDSGDATGTETKAMGEAVLKRHLLALANPARHTEAELRDEAGDWKPLRRRLGEALVDYVERYPTEATPQTAGVSATVVVTMTLEQLLHAEGHALDVAPGNGILVKMPLEKALDGALLARLV